MRASGAYPSGNVHTHTHAHEHSQTHVNVSFAGSSICIASGRANNYPHWSRRPEHVLPTRPFIVCRCAGKHSDAQAGRATHAESEICRQFTVRVAIPFSGKSNRLVTPKPNGIRTMFAHWTIGLLRRF